MRTHFLCICIPMVFLASCKPWEAQVDPMQSIEPVDQDGDGVTFDTDCNDTDPLIGFQTTWYQDLDGDLYGNLNVSELGCEAWDGYVADATDCDDGSALVNPSATEVCNGIDDDCDNAVDEGVQSMYFADADNDSFGEASSSISACSAPEGYVEDATDCDDGSASVNPSAIEVCNGIDDNCEGRVDEGATDASSWYSDVDGDGYGDMNASEVSCEAPEAFVSEASDCNDADVTVNPSATEVCNGIDDDCDSAVDEDVKTAFYGDWDGDGYGGSTVTESACEPSSGYVDNNDDCDDDTMSGMYINPSAIEVCDDVDNDCDELIDDADDSTDTSTMSTWYADADADTYGDATSSYASCEVPDGYVEDATDCDDSDVGSYPGAPETCDSLDNDCDLSVDENLYSQWYTDADGDLFGDGEVIDVVCNGSSGGLADNTDDCDDSDVGANPDASEVCDEIDNNCDGNVDEGVETTYYADADEDGYGDAVVSDDACEAPTGSVEDSTDCDDADADVNSSATEVDADGIDNDCDGGVDDQGTYCCLDADSDGYGDPLYCEYEGTGICDSGYVEGDGDCDDGNYSYHPGSLDIAGDDEDSDCDGDTED